LQCFGQRYAVISELANVLSPVVLKLERRQRDETRAQDEPSDQDPDRVFLPQLRKKARPSRDASLDASRAGSLRHFASKITQS
jgi:hypothetical protein